MELHLLVSMITIILFVGVLIDNGHVSASTITPDQMYWKSVLPDSPIPTAIKSSLQSAGNHGQKSPFRAPRVNCVIYNKAATQEQVDEYMKEYGETYTLETTMLPGRMIDVRLKTHTDNKAKFLPREARNLIPFSSDKLPEILNKFSIRPSSREAAAIKETIKNCEERHGGEDKLCAMSLESMVSFVTSKLGNRVSSVSSTSIDRDGKIKYKITGVEKLVDYGSPVVVCHKEQYPYAVFSCHDVEKTAAYVVSLAGEGVNVKAAAVCHQDTSWWSPKHVSFQVLKAKPGKTTSVCHFLDDLSIIWTKK